MEPTKLLYPPIVEAVIEFRITPRGEWKSDEIKGSIIEKLPSFSKKIQENKEFVYSISVDGKPATQTDLGCMGFKLTSEDEKYIVQFNKNNFLISQVKDYTNWEDFCKNAQDTWSVYFEMMNPQKINRVGVRYINHLKVTGVSFNLGSYFVNPPQEKQVEEWDLMQFYHKETLLVPDTQYAVNLIKTFLKSKSTDDPGGNVVFDIDVSIQKNIDCSWEVMNQHLNDMRALKNKAFFGNIRDPKIEEYLR